jgi:hypothetical protein
VVIFMSGDCSPCHLAAPVVRQLASDFASTHHFVVSCKGDTASIAGLQVVLGDEVTLLTDQRGRTAERWNVPFTPFVVGLAASGLVRAKSPHLRAHDLHSLLLEIAGDDPSKTALRSEARPV